MNEFDSMDITEYVIQAMQGDRHSNEVVKVALGRDIQGEIMRKAGYMQLFRGLMTKWVSLDTNRPK